MSVRSGKQERLPYSLSRWTDLPAAKWDWFKSQLEEGSMRAFDPRTAVPVRWSLAPEDTLGLIFWTKDPTNLIQDKALLAPYKLVVHMTLTGWEEVEKGAPGIEEGLRLMGDAIKTFGANNVTWRFSPVPLVDDVLDRFESIAARVAKAGLEDVYVSFLQENDLLPETRPRRSRVELLKLMAGRAHGLNVLLCNEDRSLEGERKHMGITNLGNGICESGKRFVKDLVDADPLLSLALEMKKAPPTEGCGCALAVDPFTINETCTMGCKYCLAPETPVLYADYVWRPLREVQVGDKLLAFDEEAPAYRKDRKFREAVVEAVWSSFQPTILIKTEETEVVTTPNHLWFEGKTRKSWKRTDHLALDCKLHSLPVTPQYEFTRDYKLGYIVGMTSGDGTFRYTPGQGHKRSEKQPYWRIALADMEPLHRLVDYMRELGAVLEIKPFDPGKSGFRGTKPMFKVESRALSVLSSVHSLLETECDSFDFKRGFLAGMFDSEGSYQKNLRIHQTKPNGLLERVQAYASSLGIPSVLEPEAARVTGSIQNRIRFFSLTQPALSRKTQNLVGRTIDFNRVSIKSIERGWIREMIDIQTSTRTFIAGGLATHNCYAADKTLADRKRNTTKTSLPLLRD